MTSRSLTKTREADAARAADTAKAAEVAQRYPGSAVWSSRDGATRVATRTPPREGLWSATLIGDSWRHLEEQLAGQAEHDRQRAGAPA